MQSIGRKSIEFEDITVVFTFHDVIDSHSGGRLTNSGISLLRLVP